MKIIKSISVVCVLTAFCAQSDTAKLSHAEMQRNFEYHYYESTGGFIQRPGEQKGKVVYVNAQKRVPREWMTVNADYFAEKLRIKVEIEDGEFNFEKPVLHGDLTVFIIDDPKMPMSLSAPEDGWSMVNIARVWSEKPQFFKARVAKLLTRGFVAVAGGCDSQYPLCVSGVVRKAEDLDVFPNHKLPVDIQARLRKYTKELGFKPSRTYTYLEACQGGWAPQPTNTIQKAIWDKVHTPPEKPLKITYDKDKQKPVVK